MLLVSGALALANLCCPVHGRCPPRSILDPAVLEEVAAKEGHSAWVRGQREGHSTRGAASSAESDSGGYDEYDG